MAAMSPNEAAHHAMWPAWLACAPVRARDTALLQFLREELGDARFTAGGMTAALVLCAEFNADIWPHPVPTCWDLVLAERAGQKSIDSAVGSSLD